MIHQEEARQGVELIDWYALRVRAQHERVVSNMLHLKGYEEFVPSYRTKKRWSDRLKELELPLFPGYVFCRFDVTKRLPILLTPGVVQVIGIGKTPIPIPEREIDALKSVVSSQLPVGPYAFLHIDQKIRVTTGALEGLEGILLVKKPFRLVVSITMLQRSVAVEVDEDWIVPISQPAVHTRLVTA